MNNESSEKKSAAEKIQAAGEKIQKVGKYLTDVGKALFSIIFFGILLIILLAIIRAAL